MLQGICSKYSSHRLFARHHSRCGFVRISSVFRVKVTYSSKQCLLQEEKPSDLKLLICLVSTSTEEYPARNMVKKTGFPLGKRFNTSHEGLNRALGGWQRVPMGWRGRARLPLPGVSEAVTSGVQTPCLLLCQRRY